MAKQLLLKTRINGSWNDTEIVTKLFVERVKVTEATSKQCMTLELVLGTDEAEKLIDNLRDAHREAIGITVTRL